MARFGGNMSCVSVDAPGAPLVDLGTGSRYVPDVDLLVHESQFTAQQLVEHPDWGHCAPEFALEVARQAGARRVVLFHHDPERTDDQLDGLAACHADSTSPVVWVAREGMTIELAER